MRWTTATNFDIGHDNQQQEHQAAEAAGAEVHGAIYKYLLVRRAAAYSTIVIYQVKVLCCETVHGVYVTNNSKTTQQQRYVCIYNWLLDCSDYASITTDQFFTLEQKNGTRHIKQNNTSSWIWTTDN